MIMSQSTTIEAHQESRTGILRMLGAAMTGLYAAYILWRTERTAIAVLRSMSDRALNDIGLTRTDITRAVRGRTVHLAFVPE
jgi:uncharacterized protein YjiS (DUF1127 family)